MNTHWLWWERLYRQLMNKKLVPDEVGEIYLTYNFMVLTLLFSDGSGSIIGGWSQHFLNVWAEFALSPIKKQLLLSNDINILSQM